MATRLPLPLTVKVRLGESASKINVEEVAALLEQAGAAAVTIHGRWGSPRLAGRQVLTVPCGEGVSVYTNGSEAAAPDRARSPATVLQADRRPAPALLQDHGAAVQEARRLGAD